MQIVFVSYFETLLAAITPQMHLIYDGKSVVKKATQQLTS